eukprot:6395181-Prymnesium_polylepis.1
MLVRFETAAVVAGPSLSALRREAHGLCESMRLQNASLSTALFSKSECVLRTLGSLCKDIIDKLKAGAFEGVAVRRPEHIGCALSRLLDAASLLDAGPAACGTSPHI